MTGLLRIEARRNTFLVLLPVLALLTALSPLVRNLTPVALWSYRSTLVEGQVQVIGPFAAGVAAWMAGRERRRGVDDVLACTPTDPWRRLLAPWAVTAAWAALCYAGTAAGAFVVTARQATWGGPDWPAVTVGLVAVVALSGIGFAVGRRFPGRFTAPLVAVGTFAVLALGTDFGFSGNRFGRLSPLFPSIEYGQGQFYPARSDLAIVQIIFLAGVLVVSLGVLALREHHGRTLVAALLAAGVALAGAGVGLAATSRSDVRGVIVPAVHDAASDRPVAFTPVCGHTALPVCVHPAYAEELPMLSTVVDDIAAPLAGSPGAPTRVEQVGGIQKSDFALHGPVLTVPAFSITGNSLGQSAFADAVRTRIALALVGSPGHGTAQLAVARYLLDQAHGTPAPGSGLTDPAVVDAARRLAALSPAARTAWFHRHLADLVAGRLTVRDLP
ncbi:MAG TPA: hypothetical protein VHF06_14860 [Pseudonocardiaceae bacterium]|nr:hypothetical protein [Pseudonocardiaceae bacterium]